MARGRRADKIKAATALELSEKLGHSERQIAKEVGLPASTVHTILSKAHGWGEIADEPVFRQNRAQQNRALEQAARSIAAKAMERAEDKIDEAGFYHLTLGAGIMIDKARLLAGESTQNVAIQSRNEVMRLEAIAAALAQELLARKAPDDEAKLIYRRRGERLDCGHCTFFSDHRWPGAVRPEKSLHHLGRPVR